MTPTFKFSFVTADGRTCCNSNDPNHLCGECKRALEAMGPIADPPDPYAPGLALLRAAGNLAEPLDTLDPYAAGLAAMKAGR